MSADGANIRLIVEHSDGAAQLGLEYAVWVCFLFPLPSASDQPFFLPDASKSGDVRVRYQNVGFAASQLLTMRKVSAPRFDFQKDAYFLDILLLE